METFHCWARSAGNTGLTVEMFVTPPNSGLPANWKGLGKRMLGGHDGQGRLELGDEVGWHALAGHHQAARLRVEAEASVELVHPGRLVFVAQAVVDGQLSAHRDVVLEIAGVLRAAEVGARTRD